MKRLLALLLCSLFAGLAPAAPVPFKNGAELEKQIKAGKNDLYFAGPRGGEIFIDREISWTFSSGTIDFRGALPKVRVPKHSAAFRVTGKLVARDFGSFTHNGNWFVIVEKNGDFAARKFYMQGTNGLFGRHGIVNLIGGKTKTRAYGLYFGDVSTGGICKVYAQDVEFLSSEPIGEAPVRNMGGYGDFVRCTFNALALTQTKKEANQQRYGVKEQKTVLTECVIDGSLNLAPLYEKGSDLGLEYKDYSLKTPLYLEFIRCKILGYAQTGGNTRVKFIDCAFSGPDPRVAKDVAITTGWAWGVRSKVEAIRCTWGTWKVKGDSGVTIRD